MLARAQVGERSGRATLELRLRSAGSRIGEQHARLEQLLEQVASALAAEDIAGTADRLEIFRASFRAHASIEERVYFAALESARPELRETLAALRREHHEIRRSLRSGARLLRRGRIPSFRAWLSRMSKDFDRHEWEERRLFSR